MSVSPLITPIGSQFLSDKCTGLGNAMFQTAATYGISKKANLTPCYNKVIQYCDLLLHKFKYNHKNTIFRNFHILSNPPLKTNSICEPMCNPAGMSIVLSKLDISSNNILNAYYEGVQFFDEYKNDIQTLFSPDQGSLDSLKKSFPFLFDNTNTVGVHFRLDHTHRHISFQDYRKCIERMKEVLGNDIHFVVFTDNLSDTNLSFFSDCKYSIINTNTDYIDMWALSMCKNYILSHSTFAFWGYYLNTSFNGKVIVPSFEMDWYDKIATNSFDGFKTNI
jgi:hypothetical protein